MTTTTFFSKIAEDTTFNNGYYRMRHIDLKGRITLNKAIEFARCMEYFEQNEDEPLSIFIDSNGGNKAAVDMIVKIINNSSLEINTVQDGRVNGIIADILLAQAPDRAYYYRHGVPCRLDYKEIAAYMKKSEKKKQRSITTSGKDKTEAIKHTEINLERTN